MVLALGLALTGLVLSALNTSGAKRDAAQRKADVDAAAAAIEFRMRTYVQGLAGIRAMVNTTEDVDPETFEQYVTSQGLLTDLPGLQALGWNRLVRASDVAAYEEDMRARQSLLPPDYAVGPPGPTDELMVVELIQPIAGNEAAFGFNIASEPTRAEAIRLTRLTGVAAATGPISLVQDDENIPGILVLLETGSEGTTDGAAVAVFRTADLLDATEQDLGHSFAVHDIGGVGRPTTEPILLSSPVDRIDEAHQAEVEVFGRRWLVSLDESEAVVASHTGLIIGGASGVALAIVLAGLIALVQRTARTADRKAIDLNHELSEANEELMVLGSRLERGMRSADVLVWEHNRTADTTWSSVGEDHDDAGIEHHFFERLHPDDRAAVKAAPEPGPGQTDIQTFRLADKHGRYRWILSRSVAITRNGEWVIIGAHIDITAQQERIELVERLNRDLTERNQSLRDFTNVASHDLRSPLRAVSSLVSFLREDLPPDVHELAEPHLRRIDDRVARMGLLIEDLLMYARAHSRDDNVETFAVADVVSDVLATVDVPEGMTVSVDSDVPAVNLAKTPFTTCLRNLVDNATKHHDKIDGHVAIAAWMEDHDLVVAVTDDGPGIDPEYLPKIFEPFRRLTVGDDTPGSGIGLSVIERSTAAHGGSIQAQSDGRGATFTIRWPSQPSANDHVTDGDASTTV